MCHEVIDGKPLKKRKAATCSRCPSNSVDVDLGETRGVVVDDDLDRWNIQAPVKEQERGQNKAISARCGRFSCSGSASYLAATSVAIRIL